MTFFIVLNCLDSCLISKYVILYFGSYSIGFLSMGMLVLMFVLMFMLMLMLVLVFMLVCSMAMTTSSMTILMVMLSSKMVVSISRVQNFHLDQIENESKDSYNEHETSLNLRWFKESHSCFHK